MVGQLSMGWILRKSMGPRLRKMTFIDEQLPSRERIYMDEASRRVDQGSGLFFLFSIPRNGSSNPDVWSSAC